MVALQLDDMRRDDAVRVGIQHHARLRPESNAAGLGCRQANIHLQIAGIERGEDLAASGKHLTYIGHPIIDRAVLRRHQLIVGNLDRVVLDLVRCCLQRLFGGVNRRLVHDQRAAGTVQRLPLLIERLDRGETSRHQVDRAGNLLLRQRHHRLLLGIIRLRLSQAVLGLFDQCLMHFELGLYVTCIHRGDDLAGFLAVAFVGPHLGNAAWVFRVDINLIRFQAAIAHDETRGQCRSQVEVPICAPACDYAHPPAIAANSMSHGHRFRLDARLGAGTFGTISAGSRPAVGEVCWMSPLVFGGSFSSGIDRDDPGVRWACVATLMAPCVDADQCARTSLSLSTDEIRTSKMEEKVSDPDMIKTKPTDPTDEHLLLFGTIIQWFARYQLLMQERRSAVPTLSRST